ncbi:unnamed protein product [Pseudo-nitzschia multistriata]|uniref:Trigger factor ribosome-binding bacterial domain-containing protein n=1 Tax=Pseudo-nitzschia multistriata TaxID=183589 RepID=A0A448ZF46_9STRA|nr:unnamed protein product [Pseudo-nitzschia multistriata]
MKFSPLFAGSIALFGLGNHATAFCPVANHGTVVSSALRATAFELVPEPEGGEEISSVKSLPGSRMKNMGEAEGLAGVRDDDEDQGPINKYWLTAKVEGPLIKEIHQTVLKESAKKANFPGFRKGQVPPFAMPQIRGFAVQEAIVQTCQSAVDAYGLKSVSGSDGEVEVLEDVPEMAKAYKLGDDLEFTATFNAIVDPELAPAEDSSSSEDGVVDVEAEVAAE